MNHILLCVPTCNRPGMVNEVLGYELVYYKKYPIDICFYDSSTNDETYKVIKQFQNQGYSFLSYKKMSSELCLDYKLVEILKEVETSNYDYLWLINDSISITEDALNIVFSLLNNNYDLVRLPLAGDGKLQDIICTDPNDWFHRCSQGMAHMASTIMSTSLLKKAPHDWGYLTERYIGGNELNDCHGYFFMVAFFLEQILKLQIFKGIFIGNRVKWRRDSPLKGEQIYWKKYVFETWAKSYVDTIKLLPEQYTDKEKVIQSSDNITPGRFSKSMLVRYRINGIYNVRTFFRYKKYFPLVSNCSIGHCLLISCIPIFILKKIYGKNNVEEYMWDIQLEHILSTIQNKKIIVYGAGLYGERVVNQLIKTMRSEQIIGIAVTDKSNSVECIENIKVYCIDELIDYRKSAAVIIATLPNTANEIRKSLKNKKFKCYYALLGF